MLTAEGRGRERRSKTVYGMFCLVSNEARVKPAGPAPRIAIFGCFEGVIFEYLICIE